MTVNEAILTLNANVVFACERAGFSSATVKMIENALDTIEDALKAQESVKPLIAYDMYFCGNCKYAMPKTVNYCPKCGKKIMWS